MPDPLVFAAARGDIQKVQQLLRLEWNVNTVADGYTALHRAAMCGHAEVASVLLDYGAEVDQGVVTSGMTPLAWAAKRDHLTTVRILLSKGADSNQPDSSGRTALHYAAQHGNDATIMELLDYSADITIVAQDGATALHLAVSATKLSTARLLLNHWEQRLGGIGPSHELMAVHQNNESFGAGLLSRIGFSKSSCTATVESAGPSMANQLLYLTHRGVAPQTHRDDVITALNALCHHNVSETQRHQMVENALKNDLVMFKALEELRNVEAGEFENRFRIDSEYHSETIRLILDCQRDLVLIFKRSQNTENLLWTRKEEHKIAIANLESNERQNRSQIENAMHEWWFDQFRRIFHRQCQVKSTIQAASASKENTFNKSFRTEAEKSVQTIAAVEASPPTKQKAALTSVNVNQPQPSRIGTGRAPSSPNSRIDFTASHLVAAKVKKALPLETGDATQQNQPQPRRIGTMLLTATLGQFIGGLAVDEGWDGENQTQAMSMPHL